MDSNSYAQVLADRVDEGPSAVERSIQLPMPTIPETVRYDSPLHMLSHYASLSLSPIAETPRDGWYDIENFLAVDFISGSVLVEFVGFKKPQFMPFVYLRWACSGLKDKRQLDHMVANRSASDIRLMPDLNSHDFEFIDIESVHAIRLLFYCPRLHDGTPEGEHEMIGYQLRGKGVIGFTTLAKMRYAYETNPRPEDLLRLDRFVLQKQEEIRAAGTDEAALIKIMGLCVKHKDCTIVRSDYRFKHFKFGFTRPLLDGDIDELGAVMLLATRCSRKLFEVEEDGAVQTRAAKRRKLIPSQVTMSDTYH